MNQITIDHIYDRLDTILQEVKSVPAGENKKDLFQALAKAQGEFKIANLNETNPYFMKKYADLVEVVNASRPALSKYGLAVIQNLHTGDDGETTLHTLLTHDSGQFIDGKLRINPPKNDIKTIDSYTNMKKRMAYASIVGVVSANEDDDGEIAMIESREIFAKGPSTKYNPKEESHAVITKEQLEDLEYEIGEYPDLAEEILDKLRINSLADIPKSKYRFVRDQVVSIKNRRNGIQ